MTLLSFFQSIIRPIFGTFETEELKKFLRMGAVFTFIIGSYWTIRVLKNALFCTFVAAAHLPYAKTASILFLIPLLMFYTKLLDTYKRDKVFYIVSAIYAVLSLVFALIIAFTQSSCAAAGQPQSWLQWIVGYAFYLFVESYGSLLPALFWAIASDTTTPDSAKKGYSLVVAIGQFGGIILPYLVAGLPHHLGLETNALSIFISAGTITLSIFLFKNFFKKTPKELLVSYHGKNEQEEEHKPEHEAGFFEGLRLLFTHKYLLGIFAVVAFPEIITTIVDLHFNSLASQTYSGTALAKYLGMYGSAVNIFAFLFLILGIGNVTRILGVGAALLLMPVLYGVAVLGFTSLSSLTFLFVLMASSKAINYALNGPAIKQLYIPTTHDAKFKAQGWIESFGSRGAKEVGAVFGMLLGPLQKQLGVVLGRARHAMFASYFGFAITFVWIFIALFLGKKYRTAIQEKKVVC
ncbi:MAG: NTP/NDP exchange transporter [Candidatus Babeliales bacterium]